MHRAHTPGILYFGTPVVLVSSLNADGTANLAPISSIFWLGWRCMIGVAATSKTTENILRSGECALNLPSADMAGAVNRLALTTGSSPVPPGKASRGYVHCADKFGRAGLTPAPSDIVAAPRAAECPVQLEAKLEAAHQMAQRDWPGGAMCLELRILRVHLDDAIMAGGAEEHVDPDLWRPLIMSFQKFYGLAAGQLQGSTLASIPEAMYRSPDVDRARSAASVR